MQVTTNNPTDPDLTGEDISGSLRADVLRLGQEAWGEGWVPELAIFAPGRLELLGNHLDYNGGRVLAGAIDRGILAVGAPSSIPDEIAVTYADPHSGERFVDALRPDELFGWQRDTPPESPTDYVRGAIAAIYAIGIVPRSGWRIAFAGDLPIGLGLSSSAALSVSLIGQLLTTDVDQRQRILLAQAAENRAGVACGTMDQAASIAGGVIRYDAATIGVEQLHPELGDLVFVVVSSGVVHRLGESAYPIRVRETVQLLRIAQDRLGTDAIANAADLTTSQLAELDAAGVLDDTMRAPSRHLISESRRVAEGYDALAAQDWTTFGELMTASGRSSATDYDVSHPQVEELVTILRTEAGVLGARMMGGGGGGSVLALVRRDRVKALERAVDQEYFRPHGFDGLTDRFLVCRFGSGARAVSPTG